MVLRLVTVPPPAVGTDWAYVVPAQWLPYLYGVTAVLTTATGSVTTIPDESGNGRTASVYTPTEYTIGNVGPFAGGVDNVAVHHDDPFINFNIPYAHSADDAAFDGAAWSAEIWFNHNKPGAANGGGIIGYFQAFNNAIDFAIDGRTNNADPYDVVVDVAGGTAYILPGFASRGAWHLVTVTYDGTNVALYRDGTLFDSRAQAVTLHATTAAQLAGSHAGGTAYGSCAGPAFFGATLTQPQIAAHAAATGSWAAYKAAVLANSPAGLWNIGKPAVGQNRLCTLKVTDGTKIVAQFPASFPTISATSFTWSWQVLGPGAQASTDGTLNAVPIPELQVDAGYVVSASTLDLAGTDQWSSIRIWFDDGTGPTPTQGSGAGALPYLDALLLPDTFLR